MHDDLEVLGNDSGTAVENSGRRQSDSSSSASTSYDDGKVLERLDTIIKRFDTVDDALKSLESRSAAKSGDNTSVVSIDSSQFDYLQQSMQVNTYLTLIVAVLLACLFGYGLWHVFSGLWEV